MGNKKQKDPRKTQVNLALRMSELADLDRLCEQDNMSRTEMFRTLMHQEADRRRREHLAGRGGYRPDGESSEQQERVQKARRLGARRVGGRNG